MYDECVEFSTLEGLTLKTASAHGDEIVFETTDDRRFVMKHEQDCCESVTVEEIHGDLSDLIGHPLLIAEDATGAAPSDYGSATWTFYKLATINGHVTIRWLGESNGYYSESVSLYEKKVRSVEDED